MIQRERERELIAEKLKRVLGSGAELGGD